MEHWLNGRKVVQYELGSPELRAAIAKSKFKDVAGFGTAGVAVYAGAKYTF